MKTPRMSRFLAPLFAFFLLFSCETEEQKTDNEDNSSENTSTIVETAQGTEALSSLVAALLKADERDGSDLVSALTGEGPFTVFAPTNEAFGALLAQLDGFNSLDDFDTDEEKELLGLILQYHVIPGVGALSTELEDEQLLNTLQGESLTVSLDKGVFIQDKTDTSAEITTPDVDNSNGVVHLINKVLLPQEVLDALQMETEGNLVDLVIETESLSLLEQAVIKAGLAETLMSEGPFTVFAPTDDAFVALLELLGEDYNSLDDFDTEEELALLTNILLYHVLPAQVLAADLVAGSVETAFSGNAIEVIETETGFAIGDASAVNAEITGTDFTATNGVAHTINKVLLPQAALDFVADMQLKTIVEIAVETDDLSLLVDALTQVNAGLVEALNGEGPFTVFAPTNQAFIDLLEVLGEDYNSLADFDSEEEVALLVDILKYHVSPGNPAFAANLLDGQQFTTLIEDKIQISLDGGVFVKDVTEIAAEVVLPDVEASNGVVHVINKVLLPQRAVDFVASLQLKTIVEIAVETDDLSLLVEALTQANAGLVEALNGEGPFTVFAPTNQAFIDLLAVLGDDYQSLSDFDTEEEIALLVDILRYHVIAGTAAFSTDLSDGQHLETLLGDSIGVSLTGGVFINDASDAAAEVVLPDVEASNGVVHVINKVLLPQAALDFVARLQLKTIVEIAVETDDLSLLVEALTQANAGLVEALSGEGPFTVFAPTNQAFIDLLAVLGDDYHSLSDFDSEEEIALLVDILKYHVVAGTAAFSADLNDGQHVETLLGDNLGISLNGGVFIKDASDIAAEVVLPDVEASNGVVHVINKVLLPQVALDFVASLQMKNIVELAQSVDELSILVEALVQADAGLIDALSSGGPLTVFAPTNDAFHHLFHALGDDYHGIEDFDSEEEKALLAQVLKYHVVTNVQLESSDIQGHIQLHMFQGEDLTVRRTNNDHIVLDDPTNRHIRVIGADNQATNGIVHLINQVLLPQEVLDALH